MARRARSVSSDSALESWSDGASRGVGRETERPGRAALRPVKGWASTLLKRAVTRAAAVRGPGARPAAPGRPRSPTLGRPLYV